MYTKLMITEVWWSALSSEGVYDKHKLEEPHVMIISSNYKLVLKPNTSTITLDSVKKAYPKNGCLCQQIVDEDTIENLRQNAT